VNDRRAAILRAASRLVVTIVLLIVVTVVCRNVPVNATTVGFAYLVVVLSIASTWGLLEAVVASVGAMLLFNLFFFPPFGTLTVADPENWVALVAFLTTAIVASQLSASAQRQNVTSIRKQHELERLYALGTSILLDRGDGPLPQRLAQAVARSFSIGGVVLHDVATGREYIGGPEDLSIPPQILSTALSGDISSRTDALDTRFSVIRLGGTPAGVLGLKGDISDTTVDAISNLIAIGLERVRTQEAENRAQTARKSEELKSTLLDAIAHEFKTPLTAIKAAITAVIGDPAIPETQRELLKIVDEEADRLNGLVTDAIETSRIEGGIFKLNLTEVQPREIISSVIRQMGTRLQDRRIHVSPIPDVTPVTVDRELVQLALRQLLDNAVKYSPAFQGIHVGVERRDGSVVFWVADEGPGVPSADRGRVFTRFYRGSSQKHGVPGSGVGLAVVRQIARAHGGDAILADTQGRGARFEVIVPATEGGGT
jgi:two-component system, OmpR family, sensor histidine kinase KdpD